MDTSPSIRRLARKLLATEAASIRTGDPPLQHEAVRVCEKLRASLTRFTGADGFAALLRRTLALARADVPSLKNLSLKPDSSLEGFEALAANEPDRGTAAATALISHLLGLLVTFIGEPLMLRLVREEWPNISLVE